MKTKFTLYTGLYTIGGVNFSVEYGKDRVIMEMGSAYNPATDVYDGIVLKRSRAWVRDAIRTQRIPAIDGIYRKQDLDGFMGLVPAEESDLNTAIFITHLHLDHMAGIGFVAPQIPIYMHKNAIQIERALEATGEGVETLERDYTPFDENQPIRVGEIEVLPILTSRRSYRDFAFLITTPDGTIHWTGDLSLHGYEAQLTFDQMEFLKQRGVDVLLCDTCAFMDEILLQINDTTDPAAIKPSREIPAGIVSCLRCSSRRQDSRSSTSTSARWTKPSATWTGLKKWAGSASSSRTAPISSINSSAPGRTCLSPILTATPTTPRSSRHGSASCWKTAGS
jgi:ribonuclease J